MQRSPEKQRNIFDRRFRALDPMHRFATSLLEKRAVFTIAICSMIPRYCVLESDETHVLAGSLFTFQKLGETQRNMCHFTRRLICEIRV
jgi:hypothetical protein